MQSFVSTVRRVLFEPTAFFRYLSPRGSVLNSLVFALLCGLISLPFSLLVAPFDPLTGVDQNIYTSFAGLLNGLGSARDMALVVLLLILAPLGAALVLYTGAGIYRLLVLLFVRSVGTGLEATFRVFACTSVVALLGWIPVLGLLIGLYGYYLSFVGVREIHGTATGRALAVVLVPVALFAVFVLAPLLPNANT